MLRGAKQAGPGVRLLAYAESGLVDATDIGQSLAYLDRVGQGALGFRAGVAVRAAPDSEG